VNNDFDLLSSCLPSPASDHGLNDSPPQKSTARNRQNVTNPPVLKRSMRNNRNNNSKFGSATVKNSNNSKKGK
jgi:hypothetical protein